jgi:hypothetical protein
MKNEQLRRPLLGDMTNSRMPSYSSTGKGAPCSFANHALQRTRRERRGCNRCLPCAGLLSLVILLTGRKDSATLRFCEQAGFQAGVKTGFIATP